MKKFKILPLIIAIVITYEIVFVFAEGTGYAGLYKLTSVPDYSSVTGYECTHTKKSEGVYTFFYVYPDGDKENNDFESYKNYLLNSKWTMESDKTNSTYSCDGLDYNSTSKYLFSINEKFIKIYLCKHSKETRYSGSGKSVVSSDSWMVMIQFNYSDFPVNGIITESPKSTEKPTSIVPSEKTPQPTQTASPAPQATAKPKMAVTSGDGNIDIKVNEKNVSFTDAKPFVDANDRTQIPIRAVAEMLGAKVSWDNTNYEATIEKDGTKVVIPIGKKEITKNGETISMDTEAIIVNERTYIPARFIAEALGYDVSYGKQ